MNKITFQETTCKQETTSLWLASVMKFGFQLDVFEAFQDFQLKMKEVKYSIYQKMLTLMMSIMVGCEHTKDINSKLHSETLCANLIGLEKFPDQSQINRMLSRMDQEAVNQLQNIHHQLFMQHSQATHGDKTVVIDFDQSGLIANGKNYELAEKGYFPKKRNQQGYQLSAAFAGEYSETIALFLDPGNVHCKERFDDLLSSTLSKFTDHVQNQKLIIRGDSGYGSAENIEKLLSIANLQFVVKGYSSRHALSLAKDISHSSYRQADESAWVYELPQQGNLRTILVQILTKNGELKYSTLHSNISKTEMNAVALFHFYNQRQTIEAFFKTAKNTYNIKNLRTKKFYGIYSFLWLVFITHNFITWFKTVAFDDVTLQKTGVRALVKQLGIIRGTVERKDEEIIVSFPPINELVKMIIQAFSSPKYEQLCLVI